MKPRAWTLTFFAITALVSAVLFPFSRVCAENVANLRSDTLDFQLDTVSGSPSEFALKISNRQKPASMAIEPSAFSLENPSRLVVDVPGHPSNQARSVEVGGEYISAIRIGAHKDKTRLVIDLREPAAPTYQIDRKGKDYGVVLFAFGGKPAAAEVETEDVHVVEPSPLAAVPTKEELPATPPTMPPPAPTPAPEPAPLPEPVTESAPTQPTPPEPAREIKPIDPAEVDLSEQIRKAEEIAREARGQKAENEKKEEERKEEVVQTPQQPVTPEPVKVEETSKPLATDIITATTPIEAPTQIEPQKPEAVAKEVELASKSIVEPPSVAPVTPTTEKVLGRELQPGLKSNSPLITAHGSETAVKEETKDLTEKIKESDPPPTEEVLTPTPSETAAKGSAHSSESLSEVSGTGPGTVSGMFYQINNDHRTFALKVTGNNLDNYKLSRPKSTEYELVLQRSKLAGQHLALPQFPPDNFQGFEAVSASQRGDDLIIRIYVEDGVKLAPFRQKNDLWIEVRAE